MPRTRDVSDAAEVLFDLRGAELGHRRDRCRQKVLIDKSEIADEAPP